MAYSLNQHTSRPDIKVGLRLNDHYADTLLPRVKELLRHKHQGFPGTQPVDFEINHIEFLEKEDYFVRDKADGKRYIMFFTAVDGGTAFMMDELCKFRILTGFKLPLRSNPNHIHNETMMDGEVVMDIDNNRRCLRYLIFDLMVLNGNVLIEKPYSKRMGMLRHDVLEPLNNVLEKNVEMKKKLPFTMEIKSMELSYGLINVLQKIPSLKHGNDGLIFIPVNHPYEPGTCKKLLLWKPITQLTIDFMIRVPNFKEEKEPIYQLFISDDKNHKFYDHLTLEPDITIQWQKNLPDGNIATFWYDKHWKTTIHREGMSPNSRDGGWRFIRFVPEKNTADHERVVELVWKSIQNAVSQDTLENRKHVIRENWKRRQSPQFPGAQPLPSPTSQTQTPSINNVFGSVLSSIPSQIFLNNSSNNNNTQLVSPSVSSSESFVLFKKRRSSEELSQMLVTSPGKKNSPTEESFLSNNSSNDNRHSYFPPVDEKKSPNQTDPKIESLDNLMKQKDFQNGPSQTFETPLQEKKSPDQEVSTRPLDTTYAPLDNSMVPSKNRLEKQSADDIQHFSGEDPTKSSKETIRPEIFPKTSPTLDRDNSLPKSDVFLNDPEAMRRNNSFQSLEQSDEEESSSIDESNDEEEAEQASSDDDLSLKEHHRMSISSNISDIANYEPSENLSGQNHNHQPIEQKPNIKEKEEETSIDQELYESQMSTKDYCVAYEDEEKEKEEEEVGSVQDSQTFKQPKKKSFQNSLKDIQIRPSQFPLEHGIPQLQNNSQAIVKSPQERIPESQEIPFHPNVSLQKIHDQPKNRPEPVQSQNSTPIPIRPQASIRENNNIQHISQGQIQEKASLSQQFQASDDQSNSTHVLNNKNQPLKLTNQLTPMQNTQPISPISNINSQLQFQKSQQDLILPQLSENQQVISQQSRQESHSTMILQQSRRQTISDNRSVIASQLQKIHAPHSVPIQIHTPLQEKQLINSSQTQIQPINSQSVFQSQVAIQEMQPQTQQPLLEYQQTSNGQYIDYKQKDLNMEQERFITKNYNNSNFQQKPMARRHTFSTNNPLHQQNFFNSYQQKQFPMTVSSYPPPRQEIASFISQPISSSNHNLPLHSSTSQGLSQIPEEYGNINHNDSSVKFTYNNYTPSQQATQQIQQQNIPPVLRPTPQKRKSKGALDFILNSGGGSNQKRSKYDNENDDAN